MRKTILLALFQASLKNPTTRDVTLTGTGDPNTLTRHAIGTQDGELAFIFDTVDGPKAGGTELMDIGIFPDSNGAMLVTSQRYTADGIKYKNVSLKTHFHC